MATKARVPLSEILTPEAMRERERLEEEAYAAAQAVKRIMIKQGLPVDANVK